MDDDIAANVVWERDERKKQAEYWEARATTAEEKAEDWRTRVLEQDIRIRKLESDVAVYMKDVDEMARERDLFEERIQKAREILLGIERWRTYECEEEINAVLNALEGK